MADKARRAPTRVNKAQSSSHAIQQEASTLRACFPKSIATVKLRLIFTNLVANRALYAWGLGCEPAATVFQMETKDHHHPKHALKLHAR